MIHIKSLFKNVNIEKNECTGCTACMNICPEQAVSMFRNQDGFWEPRMDAEKCSGCGLCIGVCHLKSEDSDVQNDEPMYYAALSKDMDNVDCSSSGGIFYELCKNILNQSGTVYGAVQTSVYEVMHKRGSSLEDVKRFRRSKYLESNLGTCYKEAEQDLKKGKKVLFSGVGCQIAGLYYYLQKNYENLYTCEVVCHGVPSYSAYKSYLAERSVQRQAAVCGINFRDKRYGWKENSICEYYEDGGKEIISSNMHPLHSLYLKGINMRSSCGFCRYAHLPRTADVTLADFWQYKGTLADISLNKGVSLAAVNNEKGRSLLREIEKLIYLEQTDKKSALESCRHMSRSPILHKSQPAFMQLLRNMSFHFAERLCTSFTTVVKETALCKMENPCLEDILSVFWNDEREIIYVLDQTGKPQGIITCGSFIRNCMKKEQWINNDFQKVLISEDCIEEIQQIFEKYSKINRVPIMDGEGFLLFEVRRDEGNDASCLKDMLRSIKPLLQLYCRGIEAYFVKRPDLLPDYTYTKEERERIEGGLSFPRLTEEIEANEILLRELFKDKYSQSYVRELRKIPQIVEIYGRYQHVDYTSEYINVINGYRKTCGQPERYSRSIHMYGRCGVFGYAVEDADTISSVLQDLFVQEEQAVRIVNHGLWGADNEKILGNLSMDIEEGIIEKNDQVVLYMDYLPYMELFQALNLHIYDSTEPFHQFMNNKTIFYDRPGHMTAEGYRYIAKYIYEILERSECLFADKEKKENIYTLLSFAEQTEKMDREKQNNSYKKELEHYLSAIEHEVSLKRGFHRDMRFDRRTGAVVMNCNPFTKGHRYLIKTCAEEVDLLFVFVVEEDKSYFPFNERFEMVKKGTKDLKNVQVLSGGRFMISALTFPEYFIKEQIQEAAVNPAKDVKIFAEQIAPRLHISIRFAGTEPKDKVTDQYNDTLRRLLPCYGIEFREIKRFKEKGHTVTATEVRKLIEQGKKERLKELVPESTYDYLEGRGYL